MIFYVWTEKYPGADQSSVLGIDDEFKDSDDAIDGKEL